jgi:vitamin B12 transporter
MKLFPFAAVCGTAFICLSVSPLVLAEEADSLDAIVVTADRKARTVDETLTPVTIITRKDIEKYQATELVDVLRRVPSVNAINSGGVGQPTSVYLRGTNASHVLVLIDGVKVGSATLGTTAFEHLPLDQIDRIEVVRGSRSSLYGSEAIGGVIQIFTRKGGKGFQPEITVGVGSNNTQKANVNLAGGNNTTWYNLNAGTEKTDGIDACNDSNACFAIPLQPDKDGYRRESASLRAGHRLADGTEIEVTALQSQGDTQYDGGFQNHTDFTQQATTGRFKHKVGEKVVITAQIGQAQDKANNFKDGVFKSRFNTQRDTSNVQADMQLGQAGGLTIGIDQQNDKIDTSMRYDRTSRKNTGMFASYQHDLGKTQMEFSGRQDDNEQFGRQNTGGIAVEHDLPNNLRLKASYNTAFKAPTMNDLYYPDDGTGVGNPKLAPETSHNTELGLQGVLPKGKWEINAFHNQVDNLITWKDIGGFKSSPFNTNKADIQGIEMVATTQLAAWNIASNLTLQRTQDKSSNQPLTYRPTQILNVDADRALGRVNIGATVHAESKRDWDDASAWPTIVRRQLPGYATLDLRADYKLSKDWTVGAKIGNVLDKQYETNKGYNQDGINGLVTLKYAPK